MYVRVYAPNGEPFDVSRERADQLILNEGWTQTAPVKEEETADEGPVVRPREPRSRKPRPRVFGDDPST